MQNNFEAKQIKNAKEMLSQDLNIAKRHLQNYKEIHKEHLKEPSLWRKISYFFSKYF